MRKNNFVLNLSIILFISVLLLLPSVAKACDCNTPNVPLSGTRLFNRLIGFIDVEGEASDGRLSNSDIEAL